jgi:preprotein translocase subunit YajC
MVSLLIPIVAQGGAAKGGQVPSGLWFMGLMIAMVVFFIVLSRGTRKSEEKKRRELLDSLKKNDRVLTHGGIIGTVLTVRDNEIVLKVDESTNTKMTFIRDAVRQIMTDPKDAALD